MGILRVNDSHFALGIFLKVSGYGYKLVYCSAFAAKFAFFFSQNFLWLCFQKVRSPK